MELAAVNTFLKVAQQSLSMLVLCWELSVKLPATFQMLWKNLKTVEEGYAGKWQFLLDPT
jgi:hypothetical protein